MNKQQTCTELHQHGTHTTGHATDTCNTCNSGFREHITYSREDVSRPRLVGSTADTDKDNREPRRECTQWLCQQYHQREESKNQHCLHTGSIRIHTCLINKDSREFTAIDRQHCYGIKGENQSHSQSIGSLDVKLGIQVRRSPEQEEPPHTVGHKLAGSESPCLLVSETLKERHLLFFFHLFNHRGGAFFIFILFDIIKFGFVDVFTLWRSIIHEYPHTHPDKTKRTDYDKCHFPAPCFCNQRNGNGSDQGTDRGTGVKDRSSVSAVLFREVFSRYFDSSREVARFTECKDTASGKEAVHTDGSQYNNHVTGSSH